MYSINIIVYCYTRELTKDRLFMKIKYIHAGVILILLMPYSFALSDECKQGFSSFWEFNQIKKNILLKEVFPLEVCNYTKKQLYANFRFILKKGKKEVFSNEIFWSEVNIYESADKAGNISGFSKKEIDYKAIKFPIIPQSIDSYEVREISSGKVVGKGAVKLKK